MAAVPATIPVVRAEVAVTLEQWSVTTATQAATPTMPTATTV